MLNARGSLLLMFALMQLVSIGCSDCPGTATQRYDLMAPEFGVRIRESTARIMPGNQTDHEKYLRRGWSDPEGESAWAADVTVRYLFERYIIGDMDIEILARPLPGLTPGQEISAEIACRPLGRGRR